VIATKDNGWPVSPTYTRQNVYELGKPWADPILWYARGVAAMMARPIAQPTSWRFYAAIHGIEPPLWQTLGYLSPTDTLPSPTFTNNFWKQCQHGTWYFLPWHRGYLLALEANIRAAVAQISGPSDWALPYWNYFKPGQADLPFEFSSPNWPDQGANPLYVAQRFGPDPNGAKVYVPLNQVDLNAMSNPDFTGVGSGGSPGFGGVDTGFSHGGVVHGDIEKQPHDAVHGLVGGVDPNDQELGGLMSDPDTAALDPIFWLHHANIDRLWASWNQGPPIHQDPTDPNWLQGPASVGQRAFSMPMADGSTWTYAPQELLDLAPLNYAYDDLSPTGAGARPPTPPVPPSTQARASFPQGGNAMVSGSNVEMLGANQGTVTVRSPTTSQVRLDPTMRQRTALRLAAHDDKTPPVVSERVFLNLENVRGRSDTSSFRVYVGVSDDEGVAEHPERLAGTVVPFGLRKASQPDGEHAGQGLTFVLDVTRIVDELRAEDSFDVDGLPVDIVPLHELSEQTQVDIGRISLFRQGE
jgi:tyrosinase